MTKYRPQSITILRRVRNAILLQKEWLEAFDLAKKLKTKKEANLPAAGETNDNSYDDAFNRKAWFRFAMFYIA